MVDGCMRKWAGFLSNLNFPPQIQTAVKATPSLDVFSFGFLLLEARGSVEGRRADDLCIYRGKVAGGVLWVVIPDYSSPMQEILDIYSFGVMEILAGRRLVDSEFGDATNIVDPDKGRDSGGS
jgi:hypothetical protein